MLYFMGNYLIKFIMFFIFYLLYKMYIFFNEKLIHISTITISKP
jgi:hypothetical protein